jgi:hypothetical protein
MVSFGSHTSQNTFNGEGLPVDVQTYSECLLSVVFNAGIVAIVPAVIVREFRTGVGMCGVNVSSHKRREPNVAIAHHTPAVRSRNGCLLDLRAQPVILSVHMTTATKKNESSACYFSTHPM